MIERFSMGTSLQVSGDICSERLVGPNASGRQRQTTVGAQRHYLSAHLHQARQKHRALPNGLRLANEAHAHPWRQVQLRQVEKMGIAQMDVDVSRRRSQDNMRADGGSLGVFRIANDRALQ